MTAWFPLFVSVAWKSAAIWGLARLVTVLLRRRSAATRHLIWTVAAAAVLVLPVLSVWAPTMPVPIERATRDAIPFVFRLTATQSGQAAVTIAGRNSMSAALAKPAGWRVDWRVGLILLWITGIVAALFQMLLTYARLRQLRRKSSRWTDVRLPEELAAQVGVSRPVDVLETCDGAMPMNCGVLRPAIFLPRDAQDWSEQRRRIVLLHELAHVRRADTTTQLVARLALIMNWWNPLAWRAWNEFLKERERATDDMVLRAGESAVDYASQLLELAQAAPALGWAAVAMARRSQLEDRLASILAPSVNRSAVGRASVFAALAATAALLVPLAGVRAQEPAAALPADVDATIRAAIAQKNHEMVFRAATAFESQRQYETAAKLLEAAVAIREDVSGAQSVDYGVGLTQLGNLEKKRRHVNEAEMFYTKALRILGDRPEAAQALLNLGILTLHRDLAQAESYFERVVPLDASLAGKAHMWLALIKERQENWTEAESLFQSAISSQEPESADLTTTRELYARFLRDRGRDAEAQQMEAMAALTRQVLEVQRGLTMREASTAYRAGDVTTPPTLASKVEPEYTDEARFAKHSGTVAITAEIGPDGVAHNIRVKKGVGLGLDENAVAAISAWRFNPGKKDGTPVTVRANIEVNFRLM